jgi:energy-coupling factor transporter ATP-binding protein EcfA2
MTDMEKNILLLHILRVPELMKEASPVMEKDRSAIFDPDMDPVLHLVLTAAVDIWNMAGEMPSKTVLSAELEGRRSADNGTEVDEAVEAVNEMLSVDSGDLMPNLGSKFLHAARVAAKKNTLIDRLSGLIRPEDIQGLINNTASEMTVMGSGEDEDDLLTPLDDPDKYLVVNPKEPMGMDFWDLISGGGFAAGEVIGLLGPTGGGKSTLAVQLACAQAKRKKHVVLNLYEQAPSGDIMERICCQFMDIPINEIRGKSITAWPEHRREEFLQIRKEYMQYLIIRNCTKMGKGDGGMESIHAALIRLEKENRLPSYVIIDWFLPMIKRYLVARGESLTNDRIRLQGYSMIDEAGQLARRFGTRILIAHQLDTKCSRMSPRRKPVVTDAMELKSFAYNMDACFLIGTQDKKTRVCWFLSDKNRRFQVIDDNMVRFNTQFIRFESISDKYVCDHRGQFVREDDMAVPPENKPAGRTAGAYRIPV